MNEDFLNMMALQLEQKYGKADIKAQRKYLSKLYDMDRADTQREYDRGMASQTDAMTSRGLGYSGIRAGAEARGLEDLTAGLSKMAFQHKYEQDALKRALRKLNESSQLQMLSQMSGGLS